MYLAPPRLDFDTVHGDLRIAAGAFGYYGYDGFGYRWGGTQWAREWSLGGGTLSFWPVPSPAGTYDLIWCGGDPSNAGFLYFSVLHDGVLLTDTVATVALARSEYAAAESPMRRWAAISDLHPNRLMRVFYSDTVNAWHEVNASGLGDYGIAMTAVDDSTVFIVWASIYTGVQWGVLSGTDWAPSTTEIPGVGVRVAIAPGGSSNTFRVAWGTLNDFVGLADFTLAGPTHVDTLRCNYPRADRTYSTDTPRFDPMTTDPPAIVWGWQDSQAQSGVCICLGGNDAHAIGEDVPAAFGGVLPTVVTDNNADVWLAWWQYGETSYWMHTYVAATALEPTVTTAGTSRVLNWHLSEPAPDSWWAILRAEGEGAFEVIDSVKAGADATMSWTDDTSPIATKLHYKIRRECRDTAYEWLSDEIVWDGATAIQLSLATATAKPDRVELVWSGPGAGGLTATVDRRTDSTAWGQIGLAESSGSDQLTFVDRAVSPGDRFAYRLVYTEEGQEWTTSTTWVEVPRLFKLSLEGFNPNPVHRVAAVSLTLPHSGRAQLEILDVAGRRVLQRRLGVLDAGPHTIDLQAALAPGVYVIRLRFDDKRLQTRGVVLR